MTTPTPPNRSKRIAAAACIAAALAAPCEGLRQRAYADTGGIMTVCYGDTHNVDRNKVYSIAECKQRLTDEMLRTVEAVDRCQPGLPDNVLAAFSDAAYNIGPAVACDTSHSTAARLLKAREYRLACGELPKWDKARVAGVMVSLPGLTKRRLLERELCLKGMT